jgi:hypothetical protein
MNNTMSKLDNLLRARAYYELRKSRILNRMNQLIKMDEQDISKQTRRANRIGAPAVPIKNEDIEKRLVTFRRALVHIEVVLMQIDNSIERYK